MASVARPGKLFTASRGLMVRQVGVLHHEPFARMVAAIVDLLHPQ